MFESGVIYIETRIDTHGLATVIVPYDGQFALLGIGTEKWVVRHFTKGEVINNFRVFCNDRTPGFNRLKVDKE